MPEGTLTNVTEHRAGSELDLDAPLGAVQITVVDIDEFDADGGTLQMPGTSSGGLFPSDSLFPSATLFPSAGSGAAGVETYVYTVPEDSDGVIDLATPLSTAHPAGEPVMLSPELVERFAYVLEEEQEEELVALIPHALYDSLVLGARNGDGEQVVVDFRGEELVVVDILGRAPVKDGSFIDPTTLPPPGSDGNPPTGSPTPTIRGALGALVVEWTAIANADPVTYEVHLSSSSGFAPSTATYATETDGTMVWLRTLPGGVPLSYGATYYVRLVAKDEDGAANVGTEASGQMAQITGPDIAANQILANHILAGEIDAEKLAAVLIISNAIKTAEDGQRVEIDPRGIRLISQAGDTLVELPTDPGLPASFRGYLQANALTVFDNFALQGPNNVVDGGTLTLSSQLANPASPPSVTIANDTFFLSGLQLFGATDHVTNRGLFYDPNGTGGPTILSALIADGEIAVFEHDTNGALINSTTIGPTILDGYEWNRVCGITRRGNIIYVLGWRGASQLVLSRLRQSDLARVSWHVITPPPSSQVDPYRSTISSIASSPNSVFVWSLDGSTASEEIRRDEYTDDNTTVGAWAHVGAVTYFGMTFDGRAGGDVIEGHVRTTATNQDWISTDRTGVHGPISFNTTTRTFEDETGFVSSSQGLAHDGTRFLSRGGGQITRHTDWTWTNNPGHKYLMVSYAWRDAVSNPPFGYLTRPSPQQALNLRPDGPTHRAYRRNRIKVTMPTRPAVAPECRIYVGHSNSATSPPPPLADGSMRNQSATSYVTTVIASPSYLIDEDEAGLVVPGAANNFPGATSLVRSQSPAWELSGTGAKGLLALNTSTDTRKMAEGTVVVNITAAQAGTAVVNHGMVGTPRVQVSIISQNTNYTVVAHTIGATSFTVAVQHKDSTSATVAVTVAWLAIG